MIPDRRCDLAPLEEYRHRLLADLLLADGDVIDQDASLAGHRLDFGLGHVADEGREFELDVDDRGGGKNGPQDGGKSD